MRLSRVKNWKRSELAELRVLVNNMSNPELSEHYGVEVHNIIHALQKFRIKRDPEFATYLRATTKEGAENPNWKGGISKDGAHYQALQRQRHPEHKWARQAVYEALQRGILSKPERCQDCGEARALQGHHESYERERWLEVIWVCRKCHRVRHQGLH